VRAIIKGTANRPRLSVHISNLHISAQIIDDETGKTMVYSSTVGKDSKGTKTERAASIGQDIAVKAKKAKISKVALDRGSRKYHGRIKALAEAARANGLEF
jgi:large subunit ribosomal protein L18